MATEFSNSLLNSLRGRILLATGALIVFSGFCGLLGYLAISLLGVSPIYSVAGAVLGMAASTAAFGWWLTNEILRPIENIALLARSLERSPSASLPKTTGAAETDEVLHTLHRNSQQLQNLISLMDDVSSGRTEAAMAPLQNPDRLSISFQKLVSKVTESIQAKEQLDRLQGSVNRLRSAVATIRTGSLKFEMAGDSRQVEEIADAVKYLVGRLNGTVHHVSSGSTSMREAAEEARKVLRSVIDGEEMQSIRLQKAATSIKNSPARARELSLQLDTAIGDFAAAFRLGENVPEPQVQIAAVNMLRKHLAESIRHLGKLRECANAIPQSARSARELSRRAGLLAVNTSLQSDPENSNTTLISSEITSLSARAEAVDREILSVNASLIGELAQLDTSLAALSADIADVAANTTRNADSFENVEKYLSKLAAVQTGMTSYAAESSSEHESLIKTLTPGVAATDGVSQLKDAEQSLISVSALATGLQESVSGLRPAASYVNGANGIGTVIDPATEATVLPADN